MNGRLALLLLIAGSAAGQPWTIEDLWNLHSVEEPRISPDGHQAVYLDRWNDRGANLVCANLQLVELAGRQARPLTEGPWRDRSPRWSPDSTRIAWISGRGGLRVRALNSGQEWSIDAEPLTFAWSADGHWIAFTAESAPAKTALAPWAPPDLLRFLIAPAKRRTALFVAPSQGGPGRQITSGDFDATGEPAWMPDGRSILTATRDGAIYFVNVADGGTRRMNEEPGRQENPLPAPNGSRIAWLASDSKPHSYSVRRLYVMNADGTRVKALAGALDRDPALPQWSSDSRTIYFAADDSGSTHIFASRADTTLRQVTNSAERLAGFSLADNGRAVAVRSTEHAIELIAFTVDLPSTPTVIVAPSAKLLKEHDSGAVEEIRVTSAGNPVQGWLVKPPGFDTARKYPLLLDIADSPRRMYGPEFSLRAQFLAAQGWLVLRVNPRGAPGYGEQFGRLLPTRYPGDDADDLLAAVDSVAARDFVDSKRIALTGGLVAAWILGHSNRFAAAVISRPIVDFTLYATSSDRNAEQALAWMGVTPWEDPDQYVHHSPIYFLKDWKTPTLLLSEGADPQADELFAALQQHKVESAGLRVADGRPASRVQEWNAAIAWLRHHAAAK